MAASSRETFYVESASNGRFRRDYNPRSGKLPTTSSEGNNSSQKKKLGVHAIAFVCFLFLQGILSGLSLTALYEARSIANVSPGEFIAQYSFSKANETRRYFFIGITWCFTGSLCLFSEDVLSVKGNNALSNNSTKSLFLLNTIFFLALVFTLLCSHVDVQISNTVLKITTEKDGLASYNGLPPLLRKWSVCVVTRSILCIVGWFVSCHRFVVMRSKVNRDE